MAKARSRPSLQFRYEHYGPECRYWAMASVRECTVSGCHR